MKKKSRNKKMRWVKYIPFVFLALFVVVSFRWLFLPPPPAHAHHVTVAVKDLTQTPPEQKTEVVVVTEAPSVSIEKEKEPAEKDVDKHGDISITAIPMELLSPIRPDLRVTVKDINQPPEVVLEDSDGDDGADHPVVGPYEEKTKPPEVPLLGVTGTAHPKFSGTPHVAIIIDDVGLNPADMDKLLKLPAAATFSFLPYAPHLQEQADRAAAQGHELMLHLPMQPLGHENPGEGALLTNLSVDENQNRLLKSLNSFSGFDGVNNHMGSKFTSDEKALTPVLKTIQQKGYFYVDSVTSGQSVGVKVATAVGLHHANRDVFIDDSQAPQAIKTQLARIEKVAAAKGYAVAIGHPHPETLRLLGPWMQEAAARGIVFVPVHDLVK